MQKGEKLPLESWLRSFISNKLINLDTPILIVRDGDSIKKSYEELTDDGFRYLLQCRVGKARFEKKDDGTLYSFILE